MEFWALQDTWDPEPYGVAAKDEQGLARLFVPGMGLVDVPSMAGITHHGGAGGHPISEAEAHRLMRMGLGRLTPLTVRSLQGSAPTIPVEMPDEASVADPGKTYIAFPRGRSPPVRRLWRSDGSCSTPLRPSGRTYLAARSPRSPGPRASSMEGSPSDGRSACGRSDRRSVEIPDGAARRVG